MLNNTSIKMKLLSGFIFVAIIAGVVGYLGITNIKTIDAADTKLYEKMTVPLGQVIDMTSYYQRMRVNIRDMVMSTTPEEQKKYEDRFLEISNAFDTSATAYEKTLLTEAGKNLYKKLKADKDAYIAVNMKIIQMVHSGTKLPELLVFMRSDESILTTKNIQASLDSTQNTKIRLAKETADENTDIANSATTTMIIIVAIAMLFAIMLGWFIARDIQSIIQSIIKETRRLVDAAVNGKLDTRGNPEQINFEFREIVVGLNKTLDAVIGPLNVAAEYIDRISKGDMPPQITDEYKGDFNEIKMNVNQCINAVQLLITDAGVLAKAAVEGKLDTRADASKHQGDFRKIVQGVNNTLDSVIGPLNVAAEYVDRISKGDIPPQITDNYNGDFNEIKMNLNQCITSVKLLVDDAGMLVKAAVEGKLDTRADASKHNGDFRKIVQGVNNTLDSVIGPLNVAAEYVDRISKGDIPPQITDNYNGDFNEIKMNLNQCISSVRLLVDDAVMLAKAAVEGKLDTRADASKHNGDFRKIVQGVNNTLDSVIGPLNVAAEYVDRISKGDIPPQITDNYNGDFNEIKMNLNQCITSVRLLVDDAGMLAKAAVEGKLDTRADASKHNGDFRKIVQGVNNTLDSVIGPLNVAAEYVDRISKGDIPPQITDNYNGDFNEIKMNLNQCITSVRLLVDDAGMLAQAAVDGKLDTRADASKHQGDFRKIVQGVNNTLDSVIGPLNVAAEYVDRISKGDIPPQITDNYNGDFNEIKMNLNQCITSVRLLVDDAAMLANAAVEGKLDTRADASKHNGDFRKIVQGVNNTLDSVIGPLNVAAEYMDRISKGDIPAKITDNYNGDFNEIKNNINQLIDNIGLIMKGVNRVANSVVNGNLDDRGNESLFSGDWKTLVHGINEIVLAFVKPINVTAEYIDRISKGDMPPVIVDEYKGDFNEIKTNLNQCITAVKLMIEDAGVLAKAATDGKLDVRADASKHNGDFRRIVQGVNDTLDSVIGPLNVAAEYVDRISKGDIPPKITDNYKGDFNEIKNNLNQCIDAVAALTNDSKLLANSAVAGDLTSRADGMKHNGDFRNIIIGVNQTLDAITKPMNDAANILSIMATGDLTSKMDGEYKGDYQILKKNINTVLDSLNNLITQITYAVEQVAEASFEISSTADTIAAASEEQGAQADEVATAVEAMSKTITQNAMAAGKTAQEAENNGRIAKEGGEVVAQTVNKMKDIANVVKKSAENIEKLGESSKQIGEIISVIDDIADQTNLLALNAAIEAARAGEQGRGFAVVADEVRKLAERTTEATKQIASMIKGIQSETQEAVIAMKHGNEEVTSGIALADKAGNALQQILVSTQDLQSMISKIALASEEQSSTSEEIAKNVNSISHVTNDSTKRIQEIAKSSEEMSKLTDNLKELVQQFKTEDSLNIHQRSGRSLKGNAGKQLPAKMQ